MSEYESLSHSRWDCKYQIVFVPKYRKKILYGKQRKFLGSVFHQLVSQRHCKIVEGHMVHIFDLTCHQLKPNYCRASTDQNQGVAKSVSLAFLVF